MKRLLLILLLAVSFVACDKDTLIENETKTLEQLKMELSKLEIYTPEADAIWAQIEPLLISVKGERIEVLQTKASGVNCFGNGWYIATDTNGDIWFMNVYAGTASNQGSLLPASVYCGYLEK